MKKPFAAAKKSMMEFCGGVDVGGTKIASALFTRAGEISAKDKIAVDKSGGDAAAGQVGDKIEALAKAARAVGGRLAAVGISVPGIAYSGSGKVWAPNIPGWDQYPLLRKIKEWGHVTEVRRGADSEKRPSEVRRSCWERRFWKIFG